MPILHHAIKDARIIRTARIETEVGADGLLGGKPVARDLPVFAVIGAFYYLRVIKYMYFDEAESEEVIAAPVDFGAALTLNGVMILGLGVFSSALIALCMNSFLV